MSKKETEGESASPARRGGPAVAAVVSDSAAPPSASSGRLPDFFIVGHEMSGTTALYEIVSQHPAVFMADLKEPRYFAPELRSRFKRLGPRQLPESLDRYLALFAAAGPDQLIGEASPQYLRSLTAAHRIAELRPDARCVAILREPARFLRSFHLRCVHNHVETETDFAKAIELEPARRRGKHIPPFSQAPQALLYSEHVRYVEQLRRLHSAFAPEQVLVLIYEDFRRDNVATAREVLRFLGVDDAYPLQPVQTPALKGVRSVPLLQLGLALTIVRGKAAAGGRPLKLLESLTPWPMRSKFLWGLWHRAVYTDPPVPDEAFMRELRRRFKAEVVALSEFLGRDLVSLWGYDSI